MKCCDRHWAALKQSVDDRGMSHLVSKDGDEAEQRWCDHTEGDELTDPLMTCFIMVVNEAIKQGGEEMVVPDERGQMKCPICEAVKRTPDTIGVVENNWTNGVADEVLRDFRERRLLPRLQ